MALKVIGAGLGRTGTLSLKLALEHLGFGPCYHMIEVMSAARERLPQWIEVVRGNPDWDAMPKAGSLRSTRRSWHRASPFAEFMEGSVLKDFGERTNNRDFMVDYFRKWEASVIAECPAERLLVHRPGDGWEPLCAFLGVDVPDEPYPRVNSSEDMLARNSNVAERLTATPEESEAFARDYIEAMRTKTFGS